jgi:hypothetical protein
MGEPVNNPVGKTVSADFADYAEKEKKKICSICAICG